MLRRPIHLATLKPSGWRTQRLGCDWAWGRYESYFSPSAEHYRPPSLLPPTRLHRTHSVAPPMPTPDHVGNGEFGRVHWPDCSAALFSWLHCTARTCYLQYEGGPRYNRRGGLRYVVYVRVLQNEIASFYSKWSVFDRSKIQLIKKIVRPEIYFHCKKRY